MAEDCELLARIAQRDAAALETLMQRHADALRRQIQAIVRDPATTDDLLQELFLRVWTRAAQFAAQGSVRGWMTRAALHLALNHLRRVRRQRSLSLETPTTFAPAPDWLIDHEAESPEKLASRAERAAEVQSRLAALDEEKRELLRLVYDAQLPLNAAAERLGIPTGTAKSRLHYTVRRLQRDWHDLRELPED